MIDRYALNLTSVQGLIHEEPKPRTYCFAISFIIPYTADTTL